MAHSAAFKIVLFFCLAFAVPFEMYGQPGLQQLDFKQLKPDGELKERLERNLERLTSERYLVSKVFRAGKTSSPADWPGDMEGRLLLSLVLEAQSLNVEPVQLRQIYEAIPRVVNKLGYFGPIENGLINEQQLSGNAWFLRGLCAHYLWKKDKTSLDQIRLLIHNLALPTLGHHKDYPIDPFVRKVNVGGASGTSQGRVGKWVLSSDTGCDFIFMDAVIQAYSILPSVKLRQLIDEMVTRFLQMDVLAIRAQTHATLTGIRGLLRYYTITGKPELLKAATHLYLTYRQNAMTVNYENFNWFQRPEWSEPCAIVDSYMVAFQLWSFTRNPDFLEDAHHIYYNALCNVQRANGGFGLSNCPGPIDNLLQVKEDEAWWCCTMRGAEGLVSALKYSYISSERTLIVTDFKTGEVTFDKGEVVIRQESEYPFKGRVVLTVLKSPAEYDINLELFAPRWSYHHQISLNNKPLSFDHKQGFLTALAKIQTGDSIVLTFEQKFETMPLSNTYGRPGYFSIHNGPLVLGSEVSDKTGEVSLTPVYHLMDKRVSKGSGFAKQVLFKLKDEK